MEDFLNFISSPIGIGIILFIIINIYFIITIVIVVRLNARRNKPEVKKT